VFQYQGVPSVALFFLFGMTKQYGNTDDGRIILEIVGRNWRTLPHFKHTKHIENERNQSDSTCIVIAKLRAFQNCASCLLNCNAPFFLSASRASRNKDKTQSVQKTALKN